MPELKNPLKRAIQGCWVPDLPLALWGLAVYPIYRRPAWDRVEPERLCYEPLSVALARAEAQVGELPSAHVPELVVSNRGRRILLGLDGDELLGGQQNRVLNVSILIDQGETRVPVSCVERNRWDRGAHGAGFRGGERLPHGLRASSHGHVHANLRTHGSHASDQRAIWRDIESGHSRHGVTSATAALHDLYRARSGTLQAFCEAMPYPRNALGMVVAIAGRWVGCDLFDQARTAEHYWPRLIRACATEALQAEHRLPQDSASDFLRSALVCQVERFPSPGLGQDLRLSSSRLQGSALIHEDTLVHLSLFAKEN